jgi:hypothetical protein
VDNARIHISTSFGAVLNSKAQELEFHLVGAAKFLLLLLPIDPDQKLSGRQAFETNHQESES